MRLSAKKRFGSVHVKATRLLRVTEDHGVPIHMTRPRDPGIPVNEHGPGFARVDDLALELVVASGKRAKRGAFVGYSYLTGEAIQARSEHRREASFAEARIALLRLPKPPAPGQEKSPVGEAFAEHVGKLIVTAKWGGYDVVAFEYWQTFKEEAYGCGEYLKEWYSYGQEGADPMDARGNLIGIIHHRKPEKGYVLMHFQPKRHASNLSVTSFQARLAIQLATRSDCIIE